ncbi:MAG: hypothetical protein FJX77_02380, partial [Armatimonadetes bacterium]|nr:hypothetical protein [Armatimonadota bacterium]
MSLPLEAGGVSGHVRFPDAEGVAAALLRLEVVRGAALPVWPPRPLPHGLFLSPERQGWVSFWSPLDDLSDWFPELTGTLECVGVLLEVLDETLFSVELYRDGECLGRNELPTRGVEQVLLEAAAAEALAQAEGGDPYEDRARLEAWMAELAESEEFRLQLEAFHTQRFRPEDLSPFLPPFATPQLAWEILTACERPGEGLEGDDLGADSYLEQFAGYL